MRRDIGKIIAILGAVMISIFAFWEVLERFFWNDAPPSSLGTFYLVRGLSTAAVMATLAAWLMARCRRRYEELLRCQSQEAQRVRRFFENIVQDAGEAIVGLDSEGIVQSWNRASEAIYGYSAEEMIGQPVDRLLPPDLISLGEKERLLDRVVREGCVRNYETRRRRKDGAIITVRITRSALRDDQGKVIGSSAIVRDITAEKEMGTRLIQAEKLAAIGQAAAGIAHEVRNALAGISGAIEVLKTSAAWTELPEGMGDEIEHQITRIAHIVDDLLNYARPGRIAPRRFDVHRILDRALAGTASGAVANGRRTEKAYTPGALLADVDPAWLEQAFSNAIANAYQAMPDGGTLRVATGRDPDAIRIEFRDTGCGMSDEVLAHAFEPFFTTKVRGTGLGLPIVRTIIEAHRGKVHLTSMPRRGTTLTMLLPQSGVQAP